MDRKTSLGRPLLILALVAAAATTAAISAGRLLTPPSFHGTAYQPPAAAADFHLTDQRGQPLSLADLHGSTVLLFFGYTRCADVCPLTLDKLQRALRTAGARPGQARVVMVTVDPSHDTPAALASYLQPFGEDFLGATGPASEVARLAAAYGVQADPRANGTHNMHTAAIFGIDRDGRLRVLMRPDSPQKVLTDDVRSLLHS
jgi:protein SCO1/2